MASSISKSLLLSQPKSGKFEGTFIPSLNHEIKENETSTEIKVEIPGLDPASVDVKFDNNILHVRCEKGELTLPVDPTVDTSKIKADILWGLLTLTVPLPEPPAARSIKVSIHETTPAKKVPEKTTASKQTVTN